jgi:hypothetical protein
LLYEITNVWEKHVTSVLRTEDKFLRNVGSHIQEYTDSQPRRPKSMSLMICIFIQILNGDETKKEWDGRGM